MCRNVEAYSLDRGFSRWICEGERVESVRVSDKRGREGCTYQAREALFVTVGNNVGE